MRQAACVPGAGNLARAAAAGLARGGAGKGHPAGSGRSGCPGAGGGLRVARESPWRRWPGSPAAPVAPGLACPVAQARPWVRFMRAATCAGDARAAGLRRAVPAARRPAAPSRRDGSPVPACGGELTGEFPVGAVGRIGCSPAACVLEGRAACGLGQRVTHARRLASGDKRGGLTGAPTATPAPMRAT
jgi:hypothetical protein